MGRRTEGHRVRYRDGVAYVRWTLDGVRSQVRLGPLDPPAADLAARQAYALALQHKPVCRRRADSGGPPRLEAEELSSWLEQAALRSATRRLYTSYARLWLDGLLVLSPAAVASYTRKRLREVAGKTVRSELAALRQYVGWLLEQGGLADPLEIPRLPHSALGTPRASGCRVAAPYYSAEEIEAFLAALPEKSEAAGFTVRRRFRFSYETGLRPATLDALSVPEHWAKGSTRLRITAEIDKEGFAREVPLSARALDVLRAEAPAIGLVFGAHRYENAVKPAAALAFPEAKARRFTPQHLRSARATHWLEGGVSLSDVAFLLGHRNVSTTDRYARMSAASAERALLRLG